MKYFYINNLRREAVNMIRAHKTARAEQASRIYETGEAENERLFTAAINRLFDGTANIVYTCHTSRDCHGNPYTNYIAYHRSPKTPGAVQASRFYIKHGNIYALSDAQHATPAEAYKDGIPSGAYIIK